MTGDALVLLELLSAPHAFLREELKLYEYSGCAVYFSKISAPLGFFFFTCSSVQRWESGKRTEI